MLRKIKFLFLTIVLSAVPAWAQARQPPNIVLLIGDDNGYPYFGFMGDHNVVTPSMDALAAGGVTFSQGHVTASICAPSLRTLITGWHPLAYSMRVSAIVAAEEKEDPNFTALSENQKRLWRRVHRAAAMQQFDTLPKLLRTKGYRSWQGGKWWEDSYKNGDFDEGMSTGWNAGLADEDGFFHELMGGKGIELGRTTMKPVFDFISENAARPFFIWYGPALPHTPFDAPYEYTKYYADKNLSESAKLYYSNITRWDQGVGRLMDYIEEMGLLDNTLFIYLSDNGWEQDAHIEYKKPGSTVYTDTTFANGGPKGKQGLYDLSFRTPIIFYWRGKLMRTFNTSSLVSSLDILPTILDIVGISAPENLPGHSLKPLLEGRTINERECIIGYADQRRSDSDPMGKQTEGYYVRTHRWHFFWYKDTNETMLYDVTVDAKGEHNLANDFPELVQSFEAKISDWKASMGMTKRVTIAN